MCFFGGLIGRRGLVFLARKKQSSVEEVTAPHRRSEEWSVAGSAFGDKGIVGGQPMQMWDVDGCPMFQGEASHFLPGPEYP